MFHKILLCHDCTSKCAVSNPCSTEMYRNYYLIFSFKYFLLRRSRPQKCRTKYTERWEHAGEWQLNLWEIKSNFVLSWIEEKYLKKYRKNFFSIQKTPTPKYRTQLHCNTDNNYITIQNKSTSQFRTKLHHNTEHNHTVRQNITTPQYRTQLYRNTEHNYTAIQKKLHQNTEHNYTTIQITTTPQCRKQLHNNSEQNYTTIQNTTTPQSRTKLHNNSEHNCTTI